MHGHRPARSRQQSEAPENPAPNTSAGSPAPVKDDVAGRQHHSHRQRLRSRSQRITPHASRALGFVVTSRRTSPRTLVAGAAREAAITGLASEPASDGVGG